MNFRSTELNSDIEARYWYHWCEMRQTNKNKAWIQRALGAALFAAIFFPRFAFADQVHLKNGSVLEGTITKETDQYVEVRLAYGTVKFARDSILKIEKASDKVFTQTKDLEFENFKINPMEELDYLTKADIYGLRKKHVSEHSGFIKGAGSYEPRGEVFQQIEDKKPWWGILGISYYGPGEKSIEGPSEESRFLSNPYLFVGIHEVNAHTVGQGWGLSPIAIYPELLLLGWNRGRTVMRARYNVSSFFDYAKSYQYTDADQRAITITDYNARDFGFNYLYFSEEKSQNVRLSEKATQPIDIIQFIHCGGSCGYAGGCNNQSPTQTELEVAITTTPAFLFVKLWRSKPSSAEDKSDADCLLELV